MSFAKDLEQELEDGAAMLRRAREECYKRAAALETTAGGCGALRQFDRLYVKFSMVVLMLWEGF